MGEQKNEVSKMSDRKQTDSKILCGLWNEFDCIPAGSCTGTTDRYPDTNSGVSMITLISAGFSKKKWGCLLTGSGTCKFRNLSIQKSANSGTSIFKNKHFQKQVLSEACISQILYCNPVFRLCIGKM